MNRLPFVVKTTVFFLSSLLLPCAVSGPRAWRVFVDAGHGGRDLGAKGQLGATEKELSLRVSRLVRDGLRTGAQRAGLSIDVHLSRDDDRFLSLRERVQLANRWSADCFISVHANSSLFPKA